MSQIDLVAQTLPPYVGNERGGMSTPTDSVPGHVGSER